MADAGVGEKLKVFISYSRKDSAEFADELLAGLKIAGFAPFLDRHDILAGEEWEVRLGHLIEQSDTAVFVVSPEAVKSERCVWEVDRTIELSKRLLPVIFKSVPDHEIPKSLARLQFVRFDIGRGITRAVPTANSKRLTATANRLILALDERSLQVDLVRLDRTIPLAGCVGSRDPGSLTPTQRAAAQIPETIGVRQR